jgi:hypothetical protein
VKLGRMKEEGMAEAREIRKSAGKLGVLMPGMGRWRRPWWPGWS